MATIASISALLTLDGQDFAKQAAKSTAEARNFALNLAAQNETMGMSANAAKLYALEQRGADAAVIATARALQQQADAQSRANDEIAEAARVVRSVVTPLETYENEIRDLSRLLVNGRITQETYARAVQQAQARYQQAVPAADNFARSVARVRAQINEAGTSFLRSVPGISAFTGAITAAIAGIVSINTAKNVLGHGIKLAADYEQATVALNTMLGDMGKAKKLLADLNDFAKATPFEMPELTSSTKKLVAFGIEQEKILPTLKSLGDVASGVGMPIDELAELYGKARVQGRLFMEDINQLTGRGIPIQKELAKQFGVAESEVRKLVESGRIGFSNLEAAMGSLTASGGQFEGMMEAQSETLTGKWSTAVDSANESLRGLIETLLEGLDAKSFVDSVSIMADALGTTLQSQLQRVIGTTNAAGQSQIEWLDILLSGAESAAKAIGYVADFVNALKIVWDTVKIAVIGFVETSIKYLSMPINLIETLINKLLEAARTMKRVSNDILGTNFDTTIQKVDLTSYRDGLVEELGKARQEVQASLSKSWSNPPSESIDSFFQELKANAQTRAAEAKQEIVSGLNDTMNPFDQLEPESKKLTQLKAGFFGHAIQDAFGIESLSKYASKIGDDLRSSAAQIIDATRTPLEKMNIEIAKLEQLRNAGLLDEETFERAVTAAQQAVQQMSNADIGIGAVEKRVTAGYQGINNRLPEQQLKVAQSSNRFLQNISTTIGQSLNNVVVAQF